MLSRLVLSINFAIALILTIACGLLALVWRALYLPWLLSIALLAISRIAAYAFARRKGRVWELDEYTKPHFSLLIIGLLLILALQNFETTWKPTGWLFYSVFVVNIFLTLYGLLWLLRVLIALFPFFYLNLHNHVDWRKTQTEHLLQAMEVQMREHLRQRAQTESPTSRRRRSRLERKQHRSSAPPYSSRPRPDEE